MVEDRIRLGSVCVLSWFYTEKSINKYIKKYERQFIFVLNSRLRKETIQSVDDSEKQK